MKQTKLSMFPLLAAVVSLGAVNLVIASPLVARIAPVYPDIRARFWLEPQCPDLTEKITFALTDTIEPNVCYNTGPLAIGFGSSWAEQLTGILYKDKELLAKQCTWSVNELNCPTSGQLVSELGLNKFVTSTDLFFEVPFPATRSWKWACVVAPPV
jgi:hypothetical protein